MSDIDDRIEQLRTEIREHDYKYYVLAEPTISDLDYDALIDELRRLEAEYPDKVTADSPTQRIGDQPVPHLNQVAHRLPMLSIDNTYSIAELQAYAARTEKLLDGEAIEWVVELKIDGAAISIVYENGLLVRAVTRGNGKIGDDIIHNRADRDRCPTSLAWRRRPRRVGGPWRNLYRQFGFCGTERASNKSWPGDIRQHAKYGRRRAPHAGSADCQRAKLADVLPWGRLLRGPQVNVAHGVPGRIAVLRPPGHTPRPRICHVSRRG